MGFVRLVLQNRMCTSMIYSSEPTRDLNINAMAEVEHVRREARWRRSSPLLPRREAAAPLVSGWQAYPFLSCEVAELCR